MSVSRMALIFLCVLFSALTFASRVNKISKSSSMFKSPFESRYVGNIVSSYASHRRLCGSNQQLGADTFEYSSDCCEERDNKCISKKQCRRPVANCVYEREDGTKEVYKSTGAKECGQCMEVDPTDPAEVVSPF